MQSGTIVKAHGVKVYPLMGELHKSRPRQFMRPLGQLTDVELKYALRKTKGCLACGFDPKALGVWDWWKALSDESRRELWDLRPSDKVDYTFTDADIIDIDDNLPDEVNASWQKFGKPVYGRRH
jgi:hypothetical protein